jgi:aerobic carbon-monoxide dehydrogenase small subunit
MAKHLIKLTVNGEEHEVEVAARTLLSELLRDHLNLTGTKRGCETAICGACTVHVDGEPVKSCLMLALQARGRKVTTIEGLCGAGGQLHPVQQAFMEHGGLQCGYCTPGMIMTAVALLERNPRPTQEQVRAGLSGNLCRCTGYVGIVDSILAAAGKNVAGKATG